DFHVTGVQTCALPILWDNVSLISLTSSKWTQASVSVPTVPTSRHLLDDGERHACSDHRPVRRPERAHGAGDPRARPRAGRAGPEIGRASCRDRGGAWG